jgi:phosphoribosyl 1,2-cyclic phosphodiesterase
MGLNFTVLGSGSSGNSTLVSDGTTYILVDAGLSGRETVTRLRACGVEPEKICAIVVSHEHGDHCRGIGPFVKNSNIPVFMTEGAFEKSGVKLKAETLRPIIPGKGFDIHGICFTDFPVPHDAVDPLGFLIEKDGVRICVALDLGFLSKPVLERMKGCDAIILESNHDVQMLKVGPYPWSLKQRVMGRRGHLSNDSVAGFLTNDFDGKATHLMLAHLSQKNNDPDVARLSAQRALEERPGSYNGNTTRLELARPDKISRTYHF